MTSKDIEQIASIVSDKIKGSVDQRYDTKMAELSTGLSHIKETLIEVKTDVKTLILVKDDHANRLTKIETQKTTMVAFLLASCAIIYEVCSTWKIFK